MGTKYATLATSGYNATPPADDGSQTASNLITWAGIKSKLSDPVKTLADAENTALVTAFDYSVRQITSSDNTVAADHMKCVEIAPTVTTAVTVSLGDAATMTNNYRVYVKNSSNRNQTVGRVTSGDTIDGTAGNLTIPPGCGVVLQTNATPNGYLATGYYEPSIVGILSSVAGTNTITAALNLSGYGSGQKFLLVPANTNTGATTLNINSLGAKNIFSRGAACVGGELEISVPALVEYDGTQFNILGAFLKGGILDISAGTLGQIKFPATQNASANANTLDDYAEVSWTPSDSSGAGLSLTVAGATAIKIGRMVNVQGSITYPATADVSSAVIGGLPYTSSNAGANIGGGGPSFNGSGTALTFVVNNSATTFQILAASNGAARTNANMASFVIRFNFWYVAAA